MKKILLIILILCLTAVVLFLNRARQAKNNAAPNAAMPTFASNAATSAPDAAPFTLYKEEGEVMYGREKGEYQALEGEEKSLSIGSWVKTGAVGLAHAELPGGHLISIGQSTEMQITQEGSTTSILQEAGKTWHRVQKLLGKEEYQVETASSVAAVRGTTFAVEVDEADREKAEVYATDGELKVGQKTVELGKKVFQNWQALSAGRLAQIVSAARARRIAISQIPEERKKLMWFRRNQVIDQEVKQKIKERIQEKVWPRLRERLEKNQELLKLRQEEIRERIMEKIPLLPQEPGANLCQIVKSEKFQTALSRMKSGEAQWIEQYRGYVDYLLNIGSLCADGKLNFEELKKLQEAGRELSRVVPPAVWPTAGKQLLPISPVFQISPLPTKPVETPAPNDPLNFTEPLEPLHLFIPPSPTPTPEKYYLR